MRKWRRWRSAIAPASAARVWPARCVLIIYVYYDVFRDTLTDRLNTRPHTAIIPRSPRLETNETTAASNPTARSWPPAAHLASSAVDDAPGQRDSIHCPTDGTVERFTADAVHSGTLLAKPRTRGRGVWACRPERPKAAESGAGAAEGRGPEQLAAEYGRVHRNDRAKHDLLDVDTAVYTALFVRSTIRWTLRRAPKP